MSKYRLIKRSSDRTSKLLVGVFLLGFVVGGCGFLGGNDDGNDEGYPEPPGRPDAAVSEQSDVELTPPDSRALYLGDVIN